MGARRRNPRPTVLEFASRRSLPSVTVRFTYADYIFVRCRLLSIAHVAVNVAVKLDLDERRPSPNPTDASSRFWRKTS